MYGTLCGLTVWRLGEAPSQKASTKAETPLADSTTVPPAKSSRPSWKSQPLGAHTQCASGQ